MYRDGVSVVVRTHDIERLPKLKRAFFSAAVQEDIATEIVVVAQRFSHDEIAVMRAALEPMLQSVAPSASVKFLNIERPRRGDLRSLLLNAGIEAASNRYLAFLDDDDIVYPHAYQHLAEDLVSSGAAIAFGGCVRVMAETASDSAFLIKSKDRPWRGNNMIELFQANFAPIHSYMIDRARINADRLKFDERHCLLEDYRFLLSLGVDHRFCFRSTDIDLCEYWHYDDNSNTTLQAKDKLSDAGKRMEQAQVDIKEFKAGLEIKTSVLELDAWLQLYAIEGASRRRRFGPLSKLTRELLEQSCMPTRLCDPAKGTTETRR